MSKRGGRRGKGGRAAKSATGAALAGAPPQRVVTHAPAEWGGVELSPLPDRIRQKMGELLAGARPTADAPRGR